MRNNSELFDILEALVGDKPLTNSLENREICHFSEYKPDTNRLPSELLKGFNKHLAGPTSEEREAYAVERAKKEEELRKWREKEMWREERPFLSDEWRWARIDAGAFRDRY